MRFLLVQLTDIHRSISARPYSALLISALCAFVLLIPLGSQRSTAQDSQACIDLNSGRFELDTQSGEVEFVIEGCTGKLHRWAAQAKKKTTKL